MLESQKVSGFCLKLWLYHVVPIMPAFAVRISWPCLLANTSTARQIREHRESLAIAAEADWDGVHTDILRVPVTG